MKKIKIEEFLRDSKEFSMQAVSRNSHLTIKNKIHGVPSEFYNNLLQVSFKRWHMVYDLDAIDEEKESAAQIKFENRAEVDSYLDGYVDDGLIEPFVTYSKDRSTALYKNTLIRQHSHSDLTALRDFFQQKDATKINPEIVLAVLPNQLHLLSMLMKEEQRFVEVCEQLHETFKDAESEQDKLFVKRLVQIILMETRSLKNLNDDDSEMKSFTWSTCFQWLVAKL